MDVKKLGVGLGIIVAMGGSYEFGKSVWNDSHKEFALVSDVEAVSLRMDLEVIHTLYRQLNDVINDKSKTTDPAQIQFYDTRIQELKMEINRLREKANK